MSPVTPSPRLQQAFTFIDGELGTILKSLGDNINSTAVNITAKHGQSPRVGHNNYTVPAVIPPANITAVTGPVAAMVSSAITNGLGQMAAGYWAVLHIAAPCNLS